MKIYLFCVLSAFLIFNTVSAQLKKDTIFLDEEWSICEKPAAEYYRIASLKADKELFYVGEVVDFFIGGEVEMRGFYNDKGMKNGHFTFYAKNGKKRKEGDFANDDMLGVWTYYDEGGNVKVQFDCKSSVDFTPLLIVTASGDTLLKDGKGHFTFNSQKDLPHIFPPSVNYTLEGQVVNGKREGDYKYWLNDKEGKSQPFYTNVYNNGIFKKSKADASFHDGSKPFSPFNLLAGNKLLKTDYFSHSNLVFGFGTSGDQKLIEFLLNGEIPEIISEAHSYKENIKDIYNIIGTVLRPNLMPAVHSGLQYAYPPPVGSQCVILSYASKANFVTIPRTIRSEITLTIDTGGFVNNTVFKGNLTTREIGKMNYYFSRLANLAPHKENGHLVNRDLKLQLITILDTPKVKTPESTIACTYLAVNSDSTLATQYITNENEKAASFIGGVYAWRKYLERNLNASVPSQDKAPRGTYTVKVQFMVDEEGNVSEVHAVEAPKKCPNCATEAERVIREGPKWEPAMKDGKRVKFQATQSITFMSLE